MSLLKYLRLVIGGWLLIKYEFLSYTLGWRLLFIPITTGALRWCGFPQ